MAEIIQPETHPLSVVARKMGEHIGLRIVQPRQKWRSLIEVAELYSAPALYRHYAFQKGEVYDYVELSGDDDKICVLEYSAGRSVTSGRIEEALLMRLEEKKRTAAVLHGDSRQPLAEFVGMQDDTAVQNLLAFPTKAQELIRKPYSPTGNHLYLVRNFDNVADALPHLQTFFS